MREAARSNHAVDFSRPTSPNVEATVVGRVPRVARLLAFAHLLDAQIRSGVYDDMAGAARKLGLSRGRITQILNLTMLCPEVQLGILSLPPVTRGRDPITERTLRPIVADAVWQKQIEMWAPIRKETTWGTPSPTTHGPGAPITRRLRRKP